MKLVQTTIGQMLERNARQWGDRDAVVFCEPNVRHTWNSLNHLVDKVAKSLIALGIKKGDHVAIWGTSVPEWLYIQLAAARMGAVLITINPEWKHKELEYALAQSDSNVLVMMPGFEKGSGAKTFVYDYIGMIQDLCPELSTTGTCPERFPNLRHIVVTSTQKVPGMINWPEFLSGGEAVTEERLVQQIKSVTAQDISMIQYTSGTTGFPKGAMLTQFNVINNALAVVEHMKLSPNDRVCGPVPFYHCFGSILLNLGCVVSGAAIVIPSPYFTGIKALEAIQSERCTALYGVPTMFIAEMDEPEFPLFDRSSLRTGIMAGAPVDKELFEAVTKKMGAREMTIAYGLTEASPVTHQTWVNDPTEKRFKTVGRPIEHTEAKIVDPYSLETLQDGEVGEIWVNGFHVMKGYYKKPKETAETIIDGWLRTGDLGVRDVEGYYRIVGRLKEMIIVGGHNVYPAEVEQALHSLLEDKVEIVQVVGIPHLKLQEVVALVVKPIPGQTLTLEEVKRRCEGKLEWPKIPRYLKTMEDFSNVMTVTGKIQKFKIAELLKKEMEEEKTTVH